MAYNPQSSVEINLDALCHNLDTVRASLPPSTEVIAVVKANAYGHGALPVAQLLQGKGVKMFGVANMAEAVELREGGIELPVLLLGGGQPGEEEEILAHNLTPVLHQWEVAEGLALCARRRGRAVRVHVKVDTGMGRLGIPWPKAPSFIARLQELGLRVEGLASHFSTADEDLDFAREQLRRFLWVASEVHRMGLKPKLHMANSAAIFNLAEAHLDMVRPGISLYGAHPSAAFKRRRPLDLKPVMTWKAKVVSLREHPPSSPISYGRTFVTQRKSTIAAISVGYADRYPRSMSNRSKVLIKGKRAPVVGRVTMDWIMVDVTDIAGVRVGEEVVLLGDGITPEEFSSWADTVPYEVLCIAGKRSKRVYKKTEG